MKITSTSLWSSALNNLMNAQRVQAEATNQYSTQKVATDLKGFGRNSEILSSYQSGLAAVSGYQDVANQVSDRLQSQNLALQTTYDAAQAARQDILNAIASGNGSALNTAIASDFNAALQGLNYQYQGDYLFAGGNDTVAPVSTTSLAQLGALANSNLAFTNGTIKKVSQVDPHTTLQTGQLASGFGANLLKSFKDFQDYITANPISGPLTEAQKTALTTITNAFDSASRDVNDALSLNGTLQNRVTNNQKSLQIQSDNYKVLIGAKTDVDLATAYSQMTQAQQAVQASSQIIAQLKTDTLLDILR